MSTDPVPPAPTAAPLASPVEPVATPISLTPVAEGERILTLDILRGVAILGILLVNIQFFALPSAEGEQWRWDGLSTPDVVARAAVEFFATFKFISIFSILFGMGLAMQNDRAAVRGTPFAGTYVRRLVALFLFGLAHAVLIWYGDILLCYALFGFVALLCRNLRPKTLLITAAVLFVVPLVIVTGIAAAFPEEATKGPPDWRYLADQRRAGLASQGAARTPSDTEISPAPTSAQNPAGVSQSTAPDAAADGTERSPSPNAIENDSAIRLFEFMADEVRVYQSGTFGEMVAHRTMTYLFLLFATSIVYSWRVLALFLLGIAFFKQRVFIDGERHRRTYRILLLLGLILGIPLEIVALFARTLEPTSALGLVLYFVGLYLGSLGLSLAYASAVALVCARPHWLARLRPLAAVGRTALSNYLAQSVICSFIFYSFGLALFDRISFAVSLLLVPAVFVLQLIISPIWLRRFRFGPMEWLWRCLTYWRIQPIRRLADHRPEPGSVNPL